MGLLSMYRRGFLLGVLILLITNVLMFSVGSPIPANAQDNSLAQVLAPRTIISGVQPITPSTVIGAQGLSNMIGAQGLSNIIGAQGLSNTLSGCTTPSSNQATLTISKQVLNPSQLATVPALDTLQFRIVVTNDNAQASVFTLTGSSSQTLCINPGRFTVTETTLPQGFSFIATYTPSGPGVQVSSDGAHCVGTNIAAGQNVACTITNTLVSSSTINNSTINNSTSSLVTPPSNNPPQSPIRTRTFIIPQGLQNAASTTANPNIATSPIPSNPPFQVCATNEGLSGSAATGVSIARLGVNAEVGTALTTRIPSAMTIVISGRVDLDNLRSQLQAFGTKTFSIVLKSDLAPEDGIMTQVANPRLEGEVLAQSKDGAKQKVFNFVLSDVRTECKYITLAQAFGPAPNTNVAPLGRMTSDGGKNIAASSITKELVGGVIVGTTPPAKTLPTVLNPPFASCQVQAATQAGSAGTPAAGTVANGNLPDNLALYVMKGDASDISSISGNTLTVELTVDLQPSDSDLAKIVNANNPYVVANLVADADNINRAHRVDFSLTDVTTDCKQVSLNTKSVFTPFPNELNP